MKTSLMTPPDRKVPYNPPDIGLGYLASALRASDIYVVVLNPNIFNREEKILSFLWDERIEVVGIKIITRLFYEARSLLSAIKRLNRNIVTVVGGPHPSGLPQRTMDELHDADFLFAGEAEVGMSRLIGMLKGDNSEKRFEDIPGLIFRSGCSVHINPPHFEPNIDRFDMPAWDLISLSDYPVASMCRFFKSYPIAPIIATRGCPCRCTFCSACLVTGEKVRFRSISLVLKEIAMLYNIYGVREFQFIDDNLTFDPSYVMKLCRDIISSGMKIGWSCPNGIRIDTVSKDMLELMKGSGCHTLCLGLESGSDKVLKRINKSLSVEAIRSKAALIKESGIMMVGMFVIGLPDETEDDIKETINLALSLPIDGASFMICSPLPGSAIFKRYLSKKGAIRWEQFGYKGTKDYNLSMVSCGRLRCLQKIAYIRFHIRPYILKKTICAISSSRHLAYFFKRVIRGFLLS